jgi:hypothetical protein
VADPVEHAIAEPVCAPLGVVLPGIEPTSGSTSPLAGSEDLGPRWRPLVLAPIPGLSTLLGTIKPPLEVIKALLSVIAALLDVLAAILIGLLDPYRALVLAAYQLLKDFFTDLINAGGYLYFDAPGITSPAPTLEDLGIPTDPAGTFEAGRTGGAPPPVVPDAYVIWGDRFAQSFDDPGDDQRPILSDGASIAAVFIAVAAPSADAVRQLLYLLGKLFNLQAFIDAWERFQLTSPDPDLSRARGDSVAPDWEAFRLKDLFPPITKLMAIPEALKALLLTGDGLASLLRDMAQAIKDKVQVLTEIVDAIQAVIDLLDALASSGMHALPVLSTTGVAGLKDAFVKAADRPPGGYMGGLCVLAAGPGIANATILWNLLGQGGAFEQLELAAEQTAATAEGAAALADLDAKAAALEETAVQAGEDMREAIENAPEALAADLGRPVNEVIETVQNAPGELNDLINEAGANVNAAVARGQTWIDNSRKKGPRSLALGVSVPPAPPQAPLPGARSVPAAPEPDPFGTPGDEPRASSSGRPADRGNQPAAPERDLFSTPTDEPLDPEGDLFGTPGDDL